MVYIYGGSAANTDLNDWQLMHSTALDDEQKQRAKQRKKEQAILKAYGQMEQRIIDKELLDIEWKKYKDFKPIDFLTSRDGYFAKEIKYALEKTNKQIEYYKGKAEDDAGNMASDEEVKNAMQAWFEYKVKMNTTKERLEHYNKKYNIKITLGHVLGKKINPWD